MEVHPDPENAYSEGKQTLNYQEFSFTRIYKDYLKKLCKGE